jgi:hypothetical protein
MNDSTGDKIVRQTEFKACWACGKQTECEKHHVVPTTYGGLNVHENRVFLCPECHAIVDRKRLQKDNELLSLYKEAAVDVKSLRWLKLLLLVHVKLLARTAYDPIQASEAAKKAIGQLLRGTGGRRKGRAKPNDVKQYRLPLTDLSVYDLLSTLSVVEKSAVRAWTSKGISRTKAEGKKTSSRPPYGYRFVKDRQVCNEKEQEIIIEIHNLASKGLSYGKISRALAKKGLFNRNGRPFDHSSIRKVLARTKPKTELPEIVRVSLKDLEDFLRVQSNKFWDVKHFELESMLPRKPATVDELIATIVLYSYDDDRVYVFSGTDEPIHVAHRTDWDTVAWADSETLNHYRIRTVPGSDFLWFSCTLEQARNGNCITLRPY